MVAGGDLPSPLEVKVGSSTYTLYGNEGKFILPNKAISDIQTQPGTSILIRVEKTVVPIGQGTVEKLSEMYKKAIKKWNIPNVSIAISKVKEGQSTKSISGSSLPSVVTLRGSGGQGTGFVISDGLVMTNRHVVIGSENKKKCKLKLRQALQSPGKSFM